MRLQSNPKKFLLHPVGSAGDVYPFVGLGLALRRRGHDVTILTSGYFQEVVQRVGLDFVDTLDRDEYLKLTNNPNLWTKMKGAGTLLESMTPELLRRCYTAIETLHEPGRTALLAPCIGFAARLAQEKLAIPLATIALQPALLWSNHDGPRLDGIWHSAPAWFKRFQYYVAERLLVDPKILPAVNGLRKQLDLKTITRITKWWLSPQQILCLFPEWLAPRQPDWTETIQFSQFPLWNENTNEDLPAEIQQFLDAGEKPIVFTPGSANRFGQQFFKESALACEQLHMRGMLFSKFDDQIPKRLPSGVKHFHYAPFKNLLPRCAAIAHHGGIGTLANSLSAGIPQLIMPLTFDQPDNAQRLKKIQAGDFLTQRQYRASTVADKLSHLIGDPSTANSCTKIAGMINNADPFEQACKTAESLFG